MYCLLTVLQDKESLWLVEEADSLEKLKNHAYFKCLMPDDKWFFVKTDYSLLVYKFATNVTTTLVGSGLVGPDGKVKLKLQTKKVPSKECPRLFHKNDLRNMQVV